MSMSKNAHTRTSAT